MSIGLGRVGAGCNGRAAAAARDSSGLLDVDVVVAEERLDFSTSSAESSPPVLLEPT